MVNPSKKFIYVFNDNARDVLLEAGFKLMKSDSDNNIYIFLNEPPKNFAVLKDVTYIERDILTY